MSERHRYGKQIQAELSLLADVREAVADMQLAARGKRPMMGHGPPLTNERLDERRDRRDQIVMAIYQKLPSLTGNRLTNWPGDIPSISKQAFDVLGATEQAAVCDLVERNKMRVR